MLAVGNPALWWTFLPAAALLVAGLVRRDRRAAIPLAFALGQFVPWLAVSRPVFSFYAVPMVPFLGLGVAAAVARLGDRLPLLAPLLGAVAGGGVVAGGVGIWDLVGGSPSRAVYGLLAAAGAAIGAARGRAPDRPRPVRGRRGRRRAAAGPAPPPGRWWPSRSRRWGSALFFLPIWLGVPMDKDLVRARWWFRGWI